MNVNWLSSWRVMALLTYQDIENSDNSRITGVFAIQTKGMRL